MGSGTNLAALSATTGIPISTLSRLESGERKPGLELLLPLARAYQVPLDVLGDQDLVLTAGEVAEFDTHLPH